MNGKVMQEFVEGNTLSVEYQVQSIPVGSTSAAFTFSKLPKMVAISLSYYYSSSNNDNFSAVCEVANRKRIYLSGMTNGAPLSMQMETYGDWFRISGWGIRMQTAYCIAFI